MKNTEKKKLIKILLIEVNSSIENVGGQQAQNGEDLRHATINIPPSPPTVPKTSRPPMYRTGWSSVERITSGSLRLSRASTRTSLASDDLDKYMNNNNGVGQQVGQQIVGASASGGGVMNTTNTIHPAGGSLNNVNMIPTNDDLIATLTGARPLPPPRISSSGSTAAAARVLSAGERRNQEFMVGGSASVDSSQQQQQQQGYHHSSSSSSMIPPPVKPRKSSSISSLNQAGGNHHHNHHLVGDHHQVAPQTSGLFSNHNLSENSNLFNLFFNS